MTIGHCYSFLMLFAFWASLHAETPVAPPHLDPPRWLAEEGIVIAGSWESLAYRHRANGQIDQLLERLRKEQSEDTARELKRLGYNIAIIPLYKGWGFAAERQGMEATKRFTEVCHKAGLKVGVYVFSGTVNYETMLSENPSAKDWFVRRPDQTRIFYGNKYYRPWVDRSHPGVREHLRELVRYAIEEAHVDLLHFDNYAIGIGYEPATLPRFREYLMQRYTSTERKQRFGFESLEHIELPPPLSAERDYRTDPLFRDFVNFRIEMLAGTFAELSQYARKLNPEIVLCINHHPYYGRVWVDPLGLPSVDHTQFLGNAHMFWAEGYPSKLKEGRLDTRMLSHKLGRQFGASVLQYTGEPVAMAESLALGLNTLGCSAWFEDGGFRPAPFSDEGTPLDKDVLALMRLHSENAALYRQATEIADVAVLHTYENDAFAKSDACARTRAFEQLLYQSKVPFAVVHSRFPGDLKRYRVVTLAGVELLPERMAAILRDYVAGGGRVWMAGAAGTFDGEYHRRETKLAAQLKAVEAPEVNLGEGVALPLNRIELLDSLRRAVGAPYRVEVSGPDTLTASAYSLPGGQRTIHLVNYDIARPARNIRIDMDAAKATRATLITPSGRGALPLRIAGTRAHLRVSEVPLYAVLVIE